jgi:hypothetical protein
MTQVNSGQGRMKLKQPKYDALITSLSGPHDEGLV